MTPNHIRVVTICVFRHGEKILVCEYFDSVDNKPFYRPLGGAVEFGETTEAAVRREIREESGQEITDLKLMTTLESIFIHEGERKHEIMYIYEARFKDNSVYERPSFDIQEDNGEVFKASWRELNFFNDYHRLVPESLVSLLKNER